MCLTSIFVLGITDNFKFTAVYFVAFYVIAGRFKKRPQKYFTSLFLSVYVPDWLSVRHPDNIRQLLEESSGNKKNK